MIDVAPLVPEARRPVLEAARAYPAHARPWFVGLLVHGSALKGGFIPGCSDIDFQVYLEEGAFAPAGHLRLEVALAIHADLAGIDPIPFQYIQGYALSSQHLREDMLQIPGTYHILAGRLPFPEATCEQVRAQAEARLAALGPYRFDVPSRLQRTVRLLCTDVWPTLYRILTLRMRDPMDVWRLPKEDAMAPLPESEPAGRDIRRFYHSVIEYYPAQDSVPMALAAIERGIVFLDSARAWHRGLEADAV